MFTRAVIRLLADEEYRALQIALILRPEQGPVIAGAHGARKLRWRRPGIGKRGGIRIIYYWDTADTAFYMLFAYAKNEQGDLSPAQARALGRLIREELK